MREFTNPIPVAACIVRNGDRILLLKRTTDPGFGLWSLPSGHYEPGENAEQGMEREIREETGLEVSVRYLKSFAKSGVNGLSYLSLLFFAETSHQDVVLDSENSEWAWVKLANSDLDSFDWAFANQKAAVLEFAASARKSDAAVSA